MDRTRLSRFLALVLRHDPGRIGLTLDRHGWVDVDDLVAAGARAGLAFTAADVRDVVAGNAKQRFALDPGGRRIRANQGHSVPVDLGLEPVEPPPVLYHGTSTPAVGRIMADGLSPMGRTHVHLSADGATAEAVGRRHGRAVVLAVDSGRMYADGHRFLVSVNGVWLTAMVPPGYLSVAVPPGYLSVAVPPGDLSATSSRRGTPTV